MKNLKPYQIFWLPIPIICIIAALMPKLINIIAVDFYQLETVNTAVFICVFLFLSGIGYYFIRNKELNKNLYKSHSRYTIAGGIICLITFLALYFKNMNEAYFKPTGASTSSKMDQFLALSFMAGILILFIGFMVYTTHILVTVFFNDKVEEK